MSLRFSTLFLLMSVVFSSVNAAVIVHPVTPVSSAEPSATEADAMAVAREYRESLKSMSASDRRELKREQRKAVKQAIRAHKDDVSDNVLLLVLITILIPPLGMYLYQGEVNDKFWISLVLTLLFYLPGLIYTLITILGS